MVLDVKMEDFKRKARLVAAGHKTKAPATITYASVVSQETVRIALMLAALNDLQVKVGDVLNAYITAPVNSLTAIRFRREPKTLPSYFWSRYVSCRVDFYVGISTKTQNTTKNTHPHHGELPPPPAAWILQLDRIRRKPDADEGFGEGAVKAI